MKRLNTKIKIKGKRDNKSKVGGKSTKEKGI